MQDDDVPRPPTAPRIRPGLRCRLYLV